MKHFFLFIMIFGVVSTHAALPRHIKSKAAAVQIGAESRYQIQKDIAFSKKESMQNRWKAVIAMSEMKGVQSVVDLKRLARMDEWFLKNAALIALNKVSSTEAQDMAKNLILDKALVVRSMAVEILKEKNSSEIRNIFWKELEKPYNFRGKNSLWIRKQILSALAQKPNHQEEEQFSRYLNDRDSEVTQIAYRAYSENFKSRE